MDKNFTHAAVVATMEELHGYFVDDLKIGMTDVYVRTVTETDIVQYSQISGDDNPLHVNEEFAKQTVFKGRIAHGMLTCGYISAVLGTKLPGPGCAYLQQNLNFREPVRIGDTVQTRVTIKKISKDTNNVTCEVVCSIGEKIVIDGTATLWVPSRRKSG
ncbi:MAG: MaoC family dehydratase [Pseudomonadota bacterium]|nr:MaoC family dehydratase [Pseudomonadota bacterium]